MLQIQLTYIRLHYPFSRSWFFYWTWYDLFICSWHNTLNEAKQWQYRKI